MSEFLSGQQLLDADDVVIVPVELADGNMVGVRSWTLKDKSSYERSLVKIDDDGKVSRDIDNVEAKLLVRTMCDAKGGRLFRDDQVEELGAKNALRLAPALAKAQELCGLREAAVEAAKKNSLPTMDSDSSTDLQAT